MKIKTPYDAAYELVCENVNKSKIYFVIDYYINKYSDKIFDTFSFVCECDVNKIKEFTSSPFNIIKLDSDLIKAQVAKFIEEHTKVVL